MGPYAFNTKAVGLIPKSFIAFRIKSVPWGPSGDFLWLLTSPFSRYSLSRHRGPVSELLEWAGASHPHRGRWAPALEARLRDTGEQHPAVTAWQVPAAWPWLPARIPSLAQCDALNPLLARLRSPSGKGQDDLGGISGNVNTSRTD